MREREPVKYNTAAYVHEQLRLTEVIRKQIVEKHRKEREKKPEPESGNPDRFSSLRTKTGEKTGNKGGVPAKMY